MDDCSGPEPPKISKNEMFLMFFGPGTGELMLGRSKNDVFLMFLGLGPAPRCSAAGALSLKKQSKHMFLMFLGPGTGELMLGRWSPEPPTISNNDVFLMFFAVQALNGPTKTINHRSTNH